MQLLAAFLAGTLSSVGAHAAEPKTEDRVAAVEARLFFAYTGTFSEPIHEGTTLWNVVIGEAGVSEPSNATFVVVHIQGKPKTYAKGKTVELKIVSEGQKKSTTRQVSRLGLFDSEGKQTIGFWLPSTGCRSLVLAASLAGTSNSVEKVIPFKCGE
jgi:hypothetical protein